MNRLDWREVPLSGRVLIEASAGTGKTHAIALIYLRLILESATDCTQILVATFSEAAAGELRGRLRARLAQALALLDGEPGAAPDEALEAYLASRCALATSEQVRSRLLLARTEFDRAPIATLHSIFSRVLREQALLTGSALSAPRVLDENQLIQEAVHDFARRALQVTAADRPYWAPLLLPPTALSELVEDLRTLFNAPDARILQFSPEQAVQARAQIATALADPEFLRALGDLAAGRSGCVLSRARIYGLRLDALLDALASAPAVDQEAVVDALAKLTLANARIKGTTNKGSSVALDTLPVVHTLDALAVWAGMLAKDNANRRARSELLGEAYRWCLDAITKRAQEREGLTFSDMIERVHAALHSPRGDALATALATTWPHALVDEFQDTDSRQFAIIERIYGQAEARSLHMVGDPKQAIYAFRGGDIEAYLRARDSVHGQRYSLDRNYRSVDGLVETLNALYAAQPDAFAHPGIRYTPQLGSQADPDDGRPSGLHIAIDRPDAGSKAGRSEWEARALCGCAESIANLLNTYGISPGEVAVLLPTHRHIAQLRTLLVERSIPVSGPGRSSVFESESGEDLILLMQACLHPGDTAALRAALATPLLGLSLTQLRMLIAGVEQSLPPALAQWDEWLQRFESWSEIWRSQGVLALMEAVLRLRACALLAREDGRRRLADLRHVAELIQQQSERGHTPRRQLAWLREQRADVASGGDTHARDERQLRIEGMQDCVRLMTGFASKGLQFAYVMLPLAFRVPGRGGKPPRILRFHDAQGRRVLDIGGPDREASAEAAEHERLQVDLRLLYVALTRAERACFVQWLPGGFDPKQTDPLSHLLQGVVCGREPIEALQECARSLPGLYVHEGWPQTVTRWSGRTRRSSSPPSTLPLPAPRKPWWLLSFSRLLRERTALVDEGLAADESVGNIAAEPAQGAPDERLLALAAVRGARLGNAVHELFEEAAAGLRLTPESALSALARHSVELPARAGEEIARRLVQRVHQTRATPLLPGGCALQALPAHAQAAEFEFLLPVREVGVTALRSLLSQHGYAHLLPPDLPGTLLNGMLTGFIDLVFEHAGRFHVLDYKTNWLGATLSGYAPDALDAAMQAEHYPLQALLYTLALHRHLRQRIEGYRCEQHLGEAVYLFVRATGLSGEHGIWRHRFEPALIEALDRLFAAIATERV